MTSVKALLARRKKFDCEDYAERVRLAILEVDAEIFGLLRTRKLVLDNPAFETLAHDLELLRIPLEKHEIAADKKLTEPLLMQESAKQRQD